MILIRQSVQLGYFAKYICVIPLLKLFSPMNSKSQKKQHYYLFQKYISLIKYYFLFTHRTDILYESILCLIRNKKQWSKWTETSAFKVLIL